MSLVHVAATTSSSAPTGPAPTEAPKPSWLTTATDWLLDKVTPTAWEIESTRDIAYQRLAIVNVVYVGAAAGAGDDGWVLVDTGVPGSSGMILRTAEARFGKRARPRAILLTHAHFDHVSGVNALLAAWGDDVPVYAHESELPFLDGRQAYPPAKTDVGGGLVSRASFTFPRGPFHVPSSALHALPSDGTVPCLPGWRWIHTPGHTPGHVSFWRESDRTLIVGDAFCTTQQESATAVATQAVRVSGPPAYFTPDVARAADSVRALAMLEPRLVVPGHGRALEGDVRGELDTGAWAAPPL